LKGKETGKNTNTFRPEIAQGGEKEDEPNTEKNSRRCRQRTVGFDLSKAGSAQVEQRNSKKGGQARHKKKKHWTRKPGTKKKGDRGQTQTNL